MKIILVNDDSYKAIGINTLKEVLVKYGEVYMFAPKEPQSAKSTAITSFLDRKVENPDKYTYIVHGTPADCVEIAEAMFDDIDLVISGCNHGYNLSADIIYSGTCGACFQALTGGLKAIAFSMHKEFCYKQIYDEVPMIMDYILKNNLLSTKYFLNVNLTRENLKSKGIKITKPMKETFKYEVIKYEDGIIHTKRSMVKQSNSTIYDYNAMKKGYISISPISIENYNNKNYLKLKQLSSK